jgi:hypothetical protein
MKKHLLLISLLAFMASCDAPRRTMAPVTGTNGNSLTSPGSTSGTIGTGTLTPSTTTGSGSGSTTTPTTGAGFETCDLTSKYQTIDMGWFGICQNTSDESSFKFKATLTSTSVRTCLIPTYKESNGSSTWVGQPQCTYTTAEQIVNGKLYKDRQGFSSYPINGVIVMKEPLLTEYFGCMNAYTSWPGNACANSANASYCAYWAPRCPYGSGSNASCDLEGRNYMAQLCNSFKAKYSSSYVDIRTK